MVDYYAHVKRSDSRLEGARPKQAQEELVRSMTEIETRYGGIYHVDDDERAALEESEEDVRAGRFASERKVREMFGRFDQA